MTATENKIEKTGFEERYLALRKKEGRLHRDAETLQLPDVAPEHPHYHEWKLRKESARRLQRYLLKKNPLLKILEAGCGNGWLCHYLSSVPGAQITGTDINFAELQQAARVFSHIPNLEFVYGGLTAAEIKYQLYDQLIFASSIQYFASLQGVLHYARSLLKSGGEIHILDSPVYSAENAASARKRTEAYYKLIGQEDMNQHYFHHTWEELETFRPVVLYQPSPFRKYLLSQKNPFPWICIRKP